MGRHADRGDPARRHAEGGDEPGYAHGHDNGRNSSPCGAGRDRDHDGHGFGGGHAGPPHAGFDLDLIWPLPSEDALLWAWSYRGEDIFAHGTLKTTDTADADGFYLITAIAGERNGETIIGLQPAGTAIPGNEPFAVDNLIRAEDHQLTGNGFGYALDDGTYANPFFADFLSPETYLEFFSASPFGPGIGTEDSEVPVDFAARELPSRPDHRGGRHHEDPGGGHGHAHWRAEHHHPTDAWFA
jgi:hypothetical protein